MNAIGNSSHTHRLLRRAVEHDAQAAAELFARHRERLRRTVRFRLDPRLRGRLTSSALLEQIFLDVCRRLPEYRAGPPQPFFLWLRRVAVERLQQIHCQHLGVTGAAREVCLCPGATPEVSAASMAAHLLGDRAANRAATRARLLLQLQEALNGLAPADREVLALCHFEDLSEAEAAAVLGTDQAAASLHYLQALQRLTEVLRSIPGFFDRGVPS
jgi:RNA polymerase sigma-70 factor (ECF subfamily)